ncbi:hypothetical protein QBC46DRAFT_340535 [Diplogelasinospora grovesii]|uniref:Uncharacterized protein n=1 Tax=Diplogelasinospora grovesii TaxID=303347 RepID=A0AAN6S516_9PEZI|nr:hypothetical protein QBC46DRAFT_340535 [Diplogelasinospora grovesii]
MSETTATFDVTRYWNTTSTSKVDLTRITTRTVDQTRYWNSTSTVLSTSEVDFTHIYIPHNRHPDSNGHPDLGYHESLEPDVHRHTARDIYCGSDTYSRRDSHEVLQHHFYRAYHSNHNINSHSHSPHNRDSSNHSHSRSEHNSHADGNSDRLGHGNVDCTSYQHCNSDSHSNANTQPNPDSGDFLHALDDKSHPHDNEHGNGGAGIHALYLQHYQGY